MDVSEQISQLASQIETLRETVTKLTAKPAEPPPEKPPEPPAEQEDKEDGLFRRFMARFKSAPEAEDKPAEKPAEDAKPAEKPADKPADDTLSLALRAALQEIEALKARMGQGDERAKADTLAKLGVLPDYHQFAPDVHTDEGKRKLEEWVSANPAIAPARVVPRPPIKVDDLPDLGPYGPSKDELARRLAAIESQDWTVR